MSDLFAGPWLTAAESAAYVRCKTVKAYYEWAKRRCLVPRHKGRCLLFDKKDLDRALKAKPPVRRIHPNSLLNLRRKTA